MPVTAILPTYNRATYLAQAIQSVLAQTYPPAQVIVVDDGSTDATREVVAGFGARVEYIYKSNGGKSSALNLALQRATGEFVWIFDDDDIAEPDSLEKLVTAMANNPQIGFAYGDYDLFTTGARGEMRTVPVSFPVVAPEELYLAVMERSFILQQGLLVRKKCYEAVGPFDETLIRSQDLDMMLRLSRHYTGVKVPGILFHLRQHSGIRGSEAVRVPANRTVEGWVKSDRKIIGKIYASHDLREFLPVALRSAEFSEDRAFTALLQRSCILARKGLWNQAAQDFRRVAEIAQASGKNSLTKTETAILRRFFDLFSYAPYTFEEAPAFRRALLELRPFRLREAIRAALFWSVPFSIGAALVNRKYANFWRFLRIGFVLATPYGLLRTLFSRSFLGEAWRLVRMRSTPTNRSRLRTGQTFSTSIA